MYTNLETELEKLMPKYTHPEIRRKIAEYYAKDFQNRSGKRYNDDIDSDTAFTRAVNDLFLIFNKGVRDNTGGAEELKLAMYEKYGVSRSVIVRTTDMNMTGMLVANIVHSR